MDITIVADQEAFFADAVTHTHPPHRWIQAKADEQSRPGSVIEEDEGEAAAEQPKPAAAEVDDESQAASDVDEGDASTEQRPNGG